MTEVVSVEADGAPAAREALDRTIGAGGVAVFPADTLYGLACDPLDAAAVARIHALKGRDDGKPSAVLYFAPLAMRELFASLGPRTLDAVGALLPGPVTLVVANPERRYPLACREDPERLGVRLITDPPLGGLMRPLFQTSANRSGAAAPVSFDQVPAQILAGDGPRGRRRRARRSAVDGRRRHGDRVGRGLEAAARGALPADEVAQALS